MIVVVANSKGGVGKSTLAVHLAAWLREQGRSVAVADCDAQQSSSDWCAEALPDVTAVRLTTPDEIIDRLPVLDREYEFVVADGPGSNVDTSRTLLLVAHLALVPCKASMLEVRALEQATRFIRQAHQVRNGEPRAVIILSMVGKRYRLTHDMRDAAAALKLPLARTPLILRQVYADAPGQGAVVSGMGTRAKEAAAEVDAVFRELFPRSAETETNKVEVGGPMTTAPRRPLTAGIAKALPGVDPASAAQFITGEPPSPPAAPSRAVADRTPRAPLTTRIRADYATALKRASLERELAGMEPYTVQEMLEQALAPWLQANGYLP